MISTSTLSRVVAQPPEPKSVHAGTADEETKTRVGKEGARTIPGRFVFFLCYLSILLARSKLFILTSFQGRPEHGGNCDIKNLSRGSKVYLPVHVKGAKFSVGDLHFSRASYSPGAVLIIIPSTPFPSSPHSHFKS